MESKRSHRRLGRGAAAFLAAAAVVLAFGASASADPPYFTPPQASVVSVGSDIAYTLDDQLSSQYNAAHSPGTPYYNWDPFGPSPIVPKVGCVAPGYPPPPGIQRPTGYQDAGALLNAVGGPTPLNPLNSQGFRTCADAVGSSIAPATGTGDVFIAYAWDAVGWSAFTGGYAPSNLTSADLRNIYTCNTIYWSQITDIPGYWGPNKFIDSYMPPLGSATRANFLTVLGLPPNFQAACWNTASPTENEGTAPIFANDASAIFPYSLGHYVGQTWQGRAEGFDSAGVLDAKRQIDGVNQLTVTGTAPNQTGVVNTTTGAHGVLNRVGIIGLTSPVSGVPYGHLLYHVVLAADWNGSSALEVTLHSLFNRSIDPTRPGWLCSHGLDTTPAASNLVLQSGYVPLKANQCGTTTLGVFPQ